MATYPAYRQHVTSVARKVDDIQIDRAGNGTARARAFFTVPKYVFEVIHPALTEAERAAIEAFYLANRLLPVDFASDFTGATHVCLMDGPPEFIPLGASRYRGRIKMVEK